MLRFKAAFFLLLQGFRGIMYQCPVGNIEKIRKARKAVKNILGEIGLEDCQNLLKVRLVFDDNWELLVRFERSKDSI